MMVSVWRLWFLLNLFLPPHICGGSLVKVIALFRHGSRTPLFPYQFHGISDGGKNSWSEGYGQLTNFGKSQLFELGQNLRKRYQDFLIPHKSVHEDVRATTTDSVRCYQSAGFLLAGLYPPNAEQEWSEELNWQPIPIIFNSPDRTKIIGDFHACPAYYSDLQAVKTEANNTDPDIHYLLTFFAKHVTSTALNDATDLFFLADYFNTKKAMNLSLPEWIPKSIYSKMNKFYVDSFNYLTRTFRMQRLLAGSLIEDIILRIDEVVYKKQSNSKFFLYSGHDSSLHSLGRTIGFQFDSVPYFGASFVFEIHHLSTNDFRIKLLYSPDHTLEKLDVWVIPNCEILCPVKKFVMLTEKYISRNWKDECSSSVTKL